MKLTTTKILAVLMAAVILAAALSACDISIGNKDNNGGGGLGDITVGGSSTPSISTPDPTDSGQTQTSTPDTTQKPTDPPSGGIDANLIGVQWYTEPLGGGRINLYFNSESDFTLEWVVATSGYHEYGVSWSHQWMGAWWREGVTHAEIVFTGKYSISDEILTLTYMTAEKRKNTDDPWQSEPLPADFASLPYKVVKNDWDPFNKIERPMLRITGLIPPFEENHTVIELSPDGSETVFWLNERYTGGPMGYLKP